jgi:hypothetical protein
MNESLPLALLDGKITAQIPKDTQGKFDPLIMRLAFDVIKMLPRSRAPNLSRTRLQFLSR